MHNSGNRKLVGLIRVKCRPLSYLLFCVIATAFVMAFAFAESASDHRLPVPRESSKGLSMATEDRVREANWWPTKGTAAPEDFVGTKACAECHGAKVATQKTTPMAGASALIENAPVLKNHEAISGKLNDFTYQASFKNGEATLTAVGDTDSISAPLKWAMGLGVHGETFILEHNGAFFESRVSYYPGLDGLDLTPGHPPSAPTSLEGALGLQLSKSDVSHCFGCHSTASTTNGHFDVAHAVEGVACEACHGPGAKHVAAMKNGDFEIGKHLIFDPAGLDQTGSVEFCGACHRTVSDVYLIGMFDIRNLRFQPYRLETSKCWKFGDARLTCVACHDPHKPLVKEAGAYDERCLRCHAASRKERPSKDHPGKACPVATQECVTCHMPKYDLPGMHSKFTDHRIRIARKGAPFPD